ncbi:hypothetical protein FisN_4Lh286 [Fistulifera solaris]|uniref:RING-type E3 ubiquitin transferase n=1 Tax=Fistulifera solaris TaxID=1519565 RepID=A0A1Z5KDC4_FISSO|nr:hypothetical protein FisN_4Lh286 [Fistulifera solaris]|eukprot:GAX24196.1 hypothetical protein FisN_4Lh286 [Fistulifera solaris]
MPFAVINVLDRHRARIQSERVTTQADETDVERGVSMAEDEDDSSLVSIPDDIVENNNTTTTTNNNNNNTNNNSERDTRPVETGDETTTIPVFTRHRMTLAELEHERELFRRRSSLCVIISIFFLLRLWIEAINEQDMGLLILCLVGTSWTARWVNHNREREQELDQMIANYNQRQTNRNDPIDMSMLSFQAQLALAILESQRQMMQGGGYGHSSDTQGVGVSEEAKQQWNRFAYHDPKAAKPSVSGVYGSVKTLEEKDDDRHHGDDTEEPHCSICLCEYEGGDACVKLPCHHIYHDECISSWTVNHTKCPLCNLELETVTINRSDEEAAAAPTNSNGLPVIV